MTPQKYELGNADSASTPAKTGTQQVVAIAENTPNIKMETRSYFLNSGWAIIGKEICFPKSSEMPRSKRSEAPPKNNAS